jgi:hypothetical protein
LKASTNFCLAQSRQARKEKQRQKLEKTTGIGYEKHVSSFCLFSCFTAIRPFEVNPLFATLRLCAKWFFFELMLLSVQGR